MADTFSESKTGLDVKISLILSIIYIFINIYYKKLLIIIIFLVIAIIYSFLIVYLSDNKTFDVQRIPMIVSFSILISFIFSLLFSTPYQEDFANKEPIKKKRKRKVYLVKMLSMTMMTLIVLLGITTLI